MDAQHPRAAVRGLDVGPQPAPGCGSATKACSLPAPVGGAVGRPEAKVTPTVAGATPEVLRADGVVEEGAEVHARDLGGRSLDAVLGDADRRPWRVQSRRITSSRERWPPVSDGW